MKPWSFESGAVNTLLTDGGLYMKIEITHQALANWKAASPSALPAPDFTTGVESVSEFIFNAPKISRVSNTEPGAAGNASISIEAKNLYIGGSGDDVSSGDIVEGVTYLNNGYDTVTYDGTDYTDGEYFVGTSTATYTTTGSGTVEKYMTIYDVIDVDYNAYDIHFRISTKTTSGGTYVVRYWGVINQRTIQRRITNLKDTKNGPQQWLVSFTVDDSLQQLTKVSAATFMEASLQRATYDYTSQYTFLTFLGQFDYAQKGLATNWYAGRYLLNAVYSDADLGDHWFEVNNTTVMRYIKIVDILQAIHNFLGCEATSINDGGSWSDFHSWQFYYNTNDSTSPGGETLVNVGIDELWVWSAFYRSSEYFEDFGFFCPIKENGQYSWKLMGDPLEVLKKICEAFGMTYRTRVNSSGERYIEYVEYGKYTTTKTVTDFELITKVEERPNDISVSGVEIVSPGSQTGSKDQASNVLWGSDGTDSMKYDCWFTSTNFIRANYEFRRTSTTSSGAYVVNVRPGDSDLFLSLYALTGITGKAATNAYSICAIAPADNGNFIGDDELPDFAEYRSAISRALVPDTTSTDPLYYTYIEMPAMALALYLYSPEGVDSNPVGFVRPKGSSIELRQVGIDHTTVEVPPMKLSVTIQGETKDYIITEIDEEIEDDVVTYRGHTRDA